MKTLKTVLKWCLGLGIFIGSFYYFKEAFVAGIIYFLAGLLIFPPSLQFIEKKIGTSLHRWVKYGGAFILIMVAAVFLAESTKEERDKLAAEEEKRKQEEFAALPKEVQDSIISAKAREDSLQIAIAAQKAEEERVQKEAEQRKEKLEKSFSAYDGSHRGLERLIKTNMNDPDSYDHVETKYWDMGDYLVVLMKYRGNNAFGGKVLGSTKAKVDLEGNVLEIIE